jgi:methionyl-tRNA formyltransferase
MNVAIIGRTKILLDSISRIKADGHKIVCIVTAKEAPEYGFGESDFREYCERFSIPYAKGANILNHTNLLANSNADIAVSINYPGIIPKSVIDIFPLGILNAHGGDLPKYRGNACQAWAILNGESKIGLCIHKMIGGELDSGDIISRSYLDINQQTKITLVYDWMASQIPSLFAESIQKLFTDKNYYLEKQSKNPEHILHCYPRKPEDGKIDWNLTNTEILRLVNATNKPFQGAYCIFKNKKMIIWDAFISNHSEEKFCAIPGQITKIQNDFVEIACGEGKIRIIEVEYDQKVQNPSGLVNSYRQRLC